MWGRYKFSIFSIVVASILTSNGIAGQETEIFGCGGFIQSPFPLDFNRIEIKLYTKQGNLKLTTESAPTTGYYFMPLDSKGEYVMRISPPEGWTFDPSEYKINFDGVSSDVCREGVDLNFEFKGFSVSGSIHTVGYLEGPLDAMVTLSGDDGFFMKTKSKAGGSFSFSSIPPGKLTLRASHPGATFHKDTFVFEVKENLKIENKIEISGYEIKGQVTSDKSGVEGVTLVLLSDADVKNVQNCQPGKPTGFVLPQTGPTQVICHQTSDKTGTFRFKNVVPGKYAVIPVYKTNIVYNVSPERVDISLNHHSIELAGFEVDGFTVLGKVKGPPGATISVIGEVRATSGDDGSFSIPKMKQGTYDFEIKADKFQFEKQTIKVTASNPILPDFLPSKFEFCGTIKMVRESAPAQLELNFQKVDGKKESQRERVSGSTGLCYFLSAGKYTVKVESQPEKFFVPESQVIQVPSGTGFAFKEFSGSIGGRVRCPLLPTGKCETRIQLVSKITGEVAAEEETKGGLFKFNNLESGEYKLAVMGTNYCWKEQEISTKLRNTNVEDIEFVQTGFTLSLTSSHSTKVTISSKQKPKKALEEVQLLKLETKGLCLKEYSGEGYEIVPSSCHTFEQSVYSVKLETAGPTKLQLTAIAHEFSGIIQTNAPLTGLQVKKNDDVLDIGKTLELLKGEKNDGSQSYALKVVAKPGESVTLHFFSYDFIFKPNSINFVAGDACQSEVFQVVAQKSHVITGKILPSLGGVELRIDLVGDPDATIYVQTDNQGEYIAGPFIHTQGFVVTPKMSGYTFKSFGDGYSFNALQWAKIQVSVEEILNASPVSSVLLSLSGPNGYRQNKVTDAKGEMVFGDLHPGTYFLKALLKEFSFEPSAIHIELQEQESKQVKLNAKRESFSMFGRLSSLSGDMMPNLMITAKGIGNCSEYGEEGISDENGHFRIWSLKSFCQYHVAVVRKDEYALRVERTIPEKLEIKIGSENVQNVTFVIIQPVKRMDISLRVRTKNVRNLESLRALIYSTKSSSDSPLFSIPFNGVPYIILPPIPKDSASYYIIFESSLSRSNFEYDLPPQINFTANEAYAHFSFEFTVEPIQHEQDIGKSSYLAFSFIILAFLVIINFEKISGYLKEGIDKYLQSTSAAAAASKRKLKAAKSQ